MTDNTSEDWVSTSEEQIASDTPPNPGHLWSFVGVWLFTFIVYARPYEWSPSLSWLSSSAFWVAISTVVLFLPTQFSVGGGLIAERESKLILGLVVTGLLSMPMAISPSVAWTQLVDYLKVVVIFIVMVSVVRTVGRLKALLLLILSITVVVSIMAVKDYLTGNFDLQGVRIEGVIGGMFANPNDLALHLVTMIPITLALAFGSKGLLAKCLYLMIALSIIAGVIATFSRAGFLGLIVTLGALTWRLARRNKGLLLACFLGPLLLIPLIAGYSSRFTTNEGSAINRMDDLKRSIYVGLNHPLAGIGLNNYRFYSNNNQASHNAYTQVFSEMGIVALVLYVALLLSPLRGLRAVGNVAGDGKRDEKSYLAIGLEAGIYGYMVSSFFASVAYLWYAYYLIAFSICVRKIALDTASTSTPLDAETTEEAEYETPDGASQGVSTAEP